jgi:hypothetical protein
VGILLWTLARQEVSSSTKEESLLRGTPPPSGEIARIVIPKSQGKQEYYDARKSVWGDLFPHDPKNGEVVRQRGIRRLKETNKPEAQPHLRVGRRRLRWSRSCVLWVLKGRSRREGRSGWAKWSVGRLIGGGRSGGRMRVGGSAVLSRSHSAVCLACLVQSLGLAIRLHSTFPSSHL